MNALNLTFPSGFGESEHRPHLLVSQPEPIAQPLLPSAEREFYEKYRWSLNVYPTVKDVVTFLRQELERLERAKAGWQLRETMLNVFLLACAISNEIDDHLVGTHYDFSKLKKVPLGGVAVRTFDRLHGLVRKGHEWRARDLYAWNQQWLAALNEFLQIFVSSTLYFSEPLANAANHLKSALDRDFPDGLVKRRLRNPAFFHVRDLTHFDILKLGEKFAAAFPDRAQPIALVGLRTAGSYFNPILRAYLKRKGYQDVDSITVRPRGIVTWKEKERIAQFAKDGRLAIIMDEPPCSGGSTAGMARLLYKAGFPRNKVVAMFPVFYQYPDWRKGWGNLLQSGTTALTLDPDEWFKKELLDSTANRNLLENYFIERGYAAAMLQESDAADHFNSELQEFSEEKMHTRLKKVYEVRLKKHSGEMETRYVLAKSVGWGWLGYHAYLLGSGLARFVPPVLGLRDGILYTEWLPQAAVPGNHPLNGPSRTVASYIAARTVCAKLEDDPTADLIEDKQHKAYDELAGLLGRAYGSSAAAAFRRPRIQKRLAEQSCPRPTVIDAKMRTLEWIHTPSGLLKTDFEHHSLGKRELQMVDPAFDLAEAILHFKLSDADEQKMVEQYIVESGDTQVRDRLFLQKLLAGTWSMIHALLNLNDQRLRHRSVDFNQQYLEAWHFLTNHTVRHLANLCTRRQISGWQSPLVVLDVDGVLDRHVFFTFPCTTAAGMKAVSLLHGHDLGIALNSARSLEEVKEYCAAYGFLGGVAEYGSAIWDAVRGEEISLVDPEAMAQLETLRAALRNIPGVFQNDIYRHSIRAFTYGRERTGPLPTQLIGGLIARLNLNRLRFHPTDLDTAVLAKNVDKGTGLRALVKQSGTPNMETIAVGDSEPDLDMFRVTNRSFAPRHIWCSDKASQLGCKIVRSAYQPGLLEIVRSIIHPDGKPCARCRSVEQAASRPNDLFMELLTVADRKRIPLLIQSLLDPMAIRTFIK